MNTPPLGLNGAAVAPTAADVAFDSFERRFVAQTVTSGAIWDALTDVERLTAWIDVLEDVETHAALDHYRATLQDNVGPFEMRADLDIRVTSLVEGKSIRFRAEGEDRQVGSRLVVEAGLAMDELADGIKVVLSGTYSVEGRVATMGGPLIKHKANALLNGFVSRLEAEFT